MGKKAFLIGRNSLGLQYAESDAWLFAKILKKHYQFETKVIRSREEFDNVFTRFIARLNINDDLIFYFSGHAMSPQGELKLVVGPDPEDLNDYILASELFPKIDQCRANQKLVILDCCRANAAFFTWRPPGEARYRFLAATSNLGVSTEIDELEAGFLTYHICKGLTANVNEVASEDGSIRIDNLFQWIQKKTFDYTNEKRLQISIPILSGDRGLEISFGELKDWGKEVKNTIFLSVPGTEEGLKQRAAILSQYEDKRLHDNWKFELVPSTADCAALAGLVPEKFKERIQPYIESSVISVQMITSKDEFDNENSAAQFKLINRQSNFSCNYKKFYWLINTSLETLQDTYDTYRHVAVESATHDMDKIFDAIDKFPDGHFIPRPGTSGKPIITFIFDHETDNDNKRRIFIKKKLYKCSEFAFRYWSVQEFPDKEGLKAAIKESSAAVIFYGLSDSKWYSIHEDIVLWQVKGSRHRKFVYLDEPDAESKLDRDVNEPEFDCIIRGDTDRLTCATFRIN